MGIKMKNRSTESSANEFDSLIEKRIDEQFNFELFMTTGQTDSKEYDYGVPEMIPVLLSSLDDERALDTEEQKSLFILWADRYFRSLFPLESHQSIWSEHSEELKRILNRAESLLIEMEPDISYDFISHKLQFEYQTKRGNGLISGSFEDLLQYMHPSYEDKTYECLYDSIEREMVRTQLFFATGSWVEEFLALCKEYYKAFIP